MLCKEPSCGTLLDGPVLPRKLRNPIPLLEHAVDLASVCFNESRKKDEVKDGAERNYGEWERRKDSGLDSGQYAHEQPVAGGIALSGSAI
jgi:hypothetical protein